MSLGPLASRLLYILLQPCPHMHGFPYKDEPPPPVAPLCSATSQWAAQRAFEPTGLVENKQWVRKLTGMIVGQSLQPTNFPRFDYGSKSYTTPEIVQASYCPPLRPPKTSRRPGHTVHVQHGAAALGAKALQRELPKPGSAWDRERVRMAPWTEEGPLGPCTQESHAPRHSRLPSPSSALLQRRKPGRFWAPNSWACARLCIFFTSDHPSHPGRRETCGERVSRVQAKGHL